MDIKKVEEAVKTILIEIGENPEREGLKDTPKRVAKAYIEMFKGYNDIDFKLTTFNSSGEDELMGDCYIPFYSVCEHHLIPFFGYAHCFYIPDKKLFGLSKLSRVVDRYSSRLQLQERMVNQIADKINDVLNPQAVVVVLQARHLCREMRGAKKKGIYTNSALRGKAHPKDNNYIPSIKVEAYTSIGLAEKGV